MICNEAHRMPNILSYLSLDFEYFSANMLFFLILLLKLEKDGIQMIQLSSWTNQLIGILL
jgi:hypothetical protein